MLITPEITTCPHCATKHLYYQAMSGNTIGATFYSDGFVQGSMYPDFKVFGKCTSCHKVFKLEEPNYDENSDHDDLPDLQQPELYDYVKFLNSSEDVSAADEEYIRTKIWWLFNDRVRMNKPLFHENSDKAIWKQNILILISMIHTNDPDSIMKKAELVRHLGQFRHCRSLLKSVKQEEYQKVKRQMLRKCMQRQRKVFVIE